jgi:hypothetical protein
MTAASAPRFSFVQVLPTLFFDVILPVVLFDLLTHYGVSTLWALIASGLSPALNNLRIWAISRRLEPLGIIVLTLLAVSAAASLISGSVFFALIKESFLTGVFGAICLVSLMGARPLLFFVVRQFVAGDDAARIEAFNTRWQDRDFRVAMRLVTAIWGIAYVVEALLRVAFALTLTPAQVVSLSPVMSFGALIVLIAWTRRYLTAVRERHERAVAA